MLFVSTIYTYKQYVIRYKRCKLFIIHSSYQRTILLAKRKRYNSTLNLTLMTVIIYTGNKVKPNRGEKWEKASTDFFSFGQQTISMKIYCI